MTFRFIPTSEENYKMARKSIENAKGEICAIYCVPVSPDMRHIKTHEFIEYFDRVSLKLLEENIRYLWIFGVYNVDTFNYLLERIKMLIEKESGRRAIEKGISRIRALDMTNVNIMPINFQIVDQESVVIGYQTSTLDDIGVEEGFICKDKEFARSLRRYFEYIWNRAIPIIDGMGTFRDVIKVDNLNRIYKKLGELYGREKINALLPKLAIISHRVLGNAILFEVPNDLINLSNRIKSDVIPHYDYVVRRFLNYAPHDKRHVERVANDCIVKIFYNDEDLFRLSPLERFILYISAWLHDIGMGLVDSKIEEIIKDKVYNQFKDFIGTNIENDLNKLIELLKSNANEANNLIRKYHALLGGCYILRSWRDLGIDSHEIAESITYIVMSHSRRFKIDKLPRLKRINDEQIHLRFLAAILRLADALDLEYRANIERYNWLEIHENEPDQTKHWAYKLLITGVNIMYNEERGYADIYISHKANDEEELKGLIAFEGINLLEELLSVKDILERDHNNIKIIINSVKIPDLNGKIIDIKDELYYWREYRDHVDTIANNIVERLRQMGLIG